MKYKFEEVLDEKELQLLRENSIPLKRKRNETAVRTIVRKMIQGLPTTEDTERIADKPLDNIVPSDLPARSTILCLSKKLKVDADHVSFLRIPRYSSYEKTLLRDAFVVSFNIPA